MKWNNNMCINNDNENIIMKIMCNNEIMIILLLMK